MSTRKVHIAAALALGLFASTFATAQVYPDRPIRIIVPWTPGGAVDILARPLAQRLSEILGQPVLVENRPGANSMIGSGIVAKSPPDGYTLLIDNVTGHAINATLYKKMPFDSLRDFAPVILLTSVTNLLVVSSSAPVNSVKDIIASAKANPGKLSYASSGSGGTAHLAGFMFGSSAGVQMIHVPYKGGAPAIADVMGGSVFMMIATLPTALQQVTGGKLKAIATTGTKRSVATPNVPTMIESGLPGFDVSTWYGALFPARTPEPIVNRVNQALNKIISAPEMRERLVGLGYEVQGGTPEEFGRHLKAETDKWGQVVKQSGAQAD